MQAGTKLPTASFTAAPKLLSVELAVSPPASALLYSGAALLGSVDGTAASGQFCKLSDNTPNGLDAARVCTLHVTAKLLQLSSRSTQHHCVTVD